MTNEDIYKKEETRSSLAEKTLKAGDWIEKEGEGEMRLRRAHHESRTRPMLFERGGEGAPEDFYEQGKNIAREQTRNEFLAIRCMRVKLEPLGQPSCLRPPQQR